MKKLIQCPNCRFEFIDNDTCSLQEEKPFALAVLLAFEKQIEEARERAARTGDIWDLREWMRLKREYL